MDYKVEYPSLHFQQKQQQQQLHANSPTKNEKCFNNSNWQQQNTANKTYHALTILSPSGSTSSSLSWSLPSSCSTPGSVSGVCGDGDSKNSRRKVLVVSKYNNSCNDNISMSNYSYGNTSVKDYIKNKNNNHHDIEEYLEDNLEDLEASRSLLREMVPYYQDDNGEFTSRRDNNNKNHTTINNNCQYIVRMTATTPTYQQLHTSQQSQNHYSLDSHVYSKSPKVVGMQNGMTQNTIASTSSPFTIQNGTDAVTASSSSTYRMRDRYASGVNSTYAADLYNGGNGSDLTPSPHNVYHHGGNMTRTTRDYHGGSSGKRDNGAYVDDYDSNNTPYGVAGMMGPGSVPTLSQGNGDATCAVCGDGHAKLHYGVLACYGCKGFFRRTLTGKYRYACRFGNNCVVDKYQRNSCRYCRFNRCLEVGMDPKAVRPDRDLTGKQRVPRARKRQIDEELISHIMRLQGDDWSRKIPVEAKVLLMQLLNIESKVIKGDSYGHGLHRDEKEDDDDFEDEDDFRMLRLRSRRQYMLDTTEHHSAQTTIDNISTTITKSVSLRELFEQKPTLQGRRTEMCFEPYRMARPEELSRIAHRSALAAVDWIDLLAEIGDFCAETEDKVALAKACYAPLTIFNLSARTVQNTKDPDILCLNNHCYVPRKLPPEFNSTTHLSNVLIDRMLNELVATLRKLNFREEEVVSLKSIIILNPNSKGLSAEAQQRVAELRDRIQDMLFQVVKELHPSYNPSSRFGNLLLILPTITTLSGVMNENMQFTQVFGSSTGTEPLLSELFEDNSARMQSSASPGGSTDEPLITSSTSALTPPLFDNPADISLQPMLSTFGIDSFARVAGTKDVSANGDTLQKVDESTQTEIISSFSNVFHQSQDVPPSFCLSQNEFDAPSKHEMIDDTLAEVVGLSSFGSSFDDASLFDDCELVDSSTFSPEMAAQLFESTNDIFELIK